MDYGKLKTWAGGNRDKLVLAVCFVVIFFVGFGSGKFVKQKSPSKLQKNYTTNEAKKPAVGEAIQQAAPQTQAQVLSATATKTPPAACTIKGNISSGSKKLYHVPGGAFYDRVKPEQCFATESEAQAAGFVRSSR